MAQDLVDNYGAFEPKVTKEDITGLVSQFEGIADWICGVLEDPKSAAGLAVSIAEATTSGYCNPDGVAVSCDTKNVRG